VSRRRSLLAELKQRRVFRVAAVYIVAAVAVMQAADVMLPALNLPGWTVTLVVALAIVGLPVAVALAWAFDIEAEGVVRTRRGGEPDAAAVVDAPGATADLAARAAGRRRRVVLAGAAVTLLVVAGVGAYATTGSRGGTDHLPDGDRTLAVLPFDNMSGDPDNEYFSDGITEEILANLATVGALSVTSRTSSMTYKDSPKTLREIARELDVRFIVEGSVRRDGDRVRITAQLIRADRDEHLWAERYDRELTDIFAIQTDIARRITDALEARLSSDERARIASIPTSSLEAYELYLRGVERVGRLTGHDARQSIHLFGQAIALDDRFAAAWAAMSRAYAWLAVFDRSMLDSAFTAAERAVELDPELPDGHLARGQAFNALGLMDSAAAAYRRTLELRPNEADAMALLGVVEYQKADYVSMLRLMRRAVALEPTNPVLHVFAGIAYFTLAQYDTAYAYFDRAHALDTTLGFLHEILAQSYVMRGEVEEGRQRLERLLHVTPDSASVLYGLAWVSAYARDYEAADHYMRRAVAAGDEHVVHWLVDRASIAMFRGDTVTALRLAAEATDSANAWIRQGNQTFVPRIMLAGAALVRGDIDAAFAAYEEAYRYGFRLFAIIDRDPLTDRVRQDPRWQRLLDRTQADIDRMWREAQRTGT